jgi:hypothetical protein
MRNAMKGVSAVDLIVLPIVAERGEPRKGRAHPGKNAAWPVVVSVSVSTGAP